MDNVSGNEGESDLLDGVEEDLYVVWSNEHHAYWRASKWGYREGLFEAGLFTEEEAKAIEQESKKESDQRYWDRALPLHAALIVGALAGTAGHWLMERLLHFERKNLP